MHLYSKNSEELDGVAIATMRRIVPDVEVIVGAAGAFLGQAEGPSSILWDTENLQSAFGDGYSFVRCGCNIASRVLRVSLEAMSALGCGETSQIDPEFRPPLLPSLPRRVIDDNAEVEKVIDSLTLGFPLSKHPKALFSPSYERGRISVVLTQYRRNTTEQQLRALFAQTCFSRVEQIVIFQNEDHVSLEFLKNIDFSSEIIEEWTAETSVHLQRNSRRKSNGLHNIIRIVYSPQYNFKYHARFALALMFDTEFTAIFDDDTIPQPQWLEIATKLSGSPYKVNE